MAESTRTVDSLYDHLFHERIEEGPRPTAYGTKGRGSFAGSCSRQISLEMLNVPESDPIDLKTLLAFRTGTLLHGMAQDAMEFTHNMIREYPIDLRNEYGWDISGNADGLYTDENGDQVLWELKSKSSFGFNKAKKDPQPDRHEIAQVGMYAISADLNVKYIHLVYLCKDQSYGRNKTQAGECIEWIIGLDEPVPGQYGDTVRQIANEEANRISSIVKETFEEGCLPQRYIPDSGIVYNVPDPDSSAQPWRCRFCRYNSMCAGMPTEKTSIEETLIPLVLQQEKGTL